MQVCVLRANELALSGESVSSEMSKSERIERNERELLLLLLLASEFHNRLSTASTPTSTEGEKINRDWPFLCHQKKKEKGTDDMTPALSLTWVYILRTYAQIDNQRSSAMICNRFEIIRMICNLMIDDSTENNRWFGWPHHSVQPSGSFNYGSYSKDLSNNNKRQESAADCCWLFGESNIDASIVIDYLRLFSENR